jgi:hypothetical protein
VKSGAGEDRCQGCARILNKTIEVIRSIIYLFLLRPVTNFCDLADMTIHDPKANTGFPDPAENKETVTDLIYAQNVKNNFRPAVCRVQFAGSSFPFTYLPVSLCSPYIDP